MNIVFVNSTKSWGGIKTWMLKLGHFLARRGHQVSMVCRREDALTGECAKRDLSCIPIHFGPDFSLVTIFWFLRFLRDQQAQAVITNVSKDLRTAGVAARLRGIAHINRLGNTRDVKNTLKARLLYNALTDRVFVPSQNLFDHFATYDFLRGKLRMFHNAVTPPPFIQRQNPVLKFAVVAKLSRRKQVDKVLQAFHRLQALPWELHIGGFGPESEALQILTQTLGLTSRVHFAGRVDPYEFLQDKDIGILYSNHEAFGYAILEYLSMSCAVVASNVGGIPEILEDRVSGFLVDPHDLDDLQHALRRLITDSEQRAALARSGYERVCTQFNQHTIFTRIEAEIQRMINQKRDR